MGLFDSLSRKEIEITPQGALLLSAITMVAIDGDIDDDEVAIITRMNKGDNPYDFDNALKFWKKNSYTDCVKKVAEVVNREEQKTVMANLIDIAMADGSFDGDEEKLAEEYIVAFDMDIEFVRQVVDMISIKNKIL